MDIKIEAEKYLLWKVGKGNISFWWDNWTGKGPLAKLNPSTMVNRRTKVSDFIEAGTWNIAKPSPTLLLQLVNSIANIQIQDGKEDSFIWTLNPSGDFTCRSAWEKMRKQGGRSLTSNMIWQKKIPFKVSFLMKRVLEGRLPTDDRIQRIGIIITSKKFRWGGVIRNDAGDMVGAFSEFYGNCSNNMAEAKAMLKGIILRKDKFSGHITVETDSQLLVNIINNNARPPWEIKGIMEKIVDCAGKEIVQQLIFSEKGIVRLTY
nr:PREDICTED: uncharacterized protein LOC104238278 [Nicotiana sylvestris]XP_016458774.1 PREDICTED: uncharacterized protein LOC107782404 [Nicotiana tabacum]